MYHGRFQELDKGFDFYAPQVFQHEGRQILLGWMGMPDRDMDYPTKEKGWMYSLTMPRVLTLRQGHIFSQPARELRALRVEETAVDIDAEAVSSMAQPLSEGAEILLDIHLGEASNVDIALNYGMEKLLFHYDRLTQIMTIDRDGMKLGGRGQRRFKLYVDKVLYLQLFVDKTASEAFFQHGEEAATLFVFPQKHILPELSLSADKPLETVSGRIWELEAIRFHVHQ